MSIWYSTTDCTYVASNQFKLTGDLRSQFPDTIRVRVYCGGLWKYSSVVSTIYGGGETTVTIDKTNLTNPTTSCEIGGATSGDSGSIPDHDHSSIGQGGSEVIGTPPSHTITGPRIYFEGYPPYDIGFGTKVGSRGTAGESGTQGVQGYQGVQGDKGFQGEQGDQGPQGYQGNQGAQGPPGEGEGSGHYTDEIFIHWDYDTYAETAAVCKAMPATQGRVLVNTEQIDCSTSKVLVFDSSSDYLVSESGGSVSIGSTALGSLTTGYNDHSLLYLYVTNSNSCWNFSSPSTKDYRSSLIASDTAPTDEGGYMASSGDGANARHVGWFVLNSSRELDCILSICSAFHPTGQIYNWSAGTGEWTSFSTSSPVTSDIVYCVVPKYWTFAVTMDTAVQNWGTSDTTHNISLHWDGSAQREKELEIQAYTGGYTGHVKNCTLSISEFVQNTGTDYVKDFYGELTCSITASSKYYQKGTNFYLEIYPRFVGR